MSEGGWMFVAGIAMLFVFGYLIPQAFSIFPDAGRIDNPVMKTIITGGGAWNFVNDGIRINLISLVTFPLSSIVNLTGIPASIPSPTIPLTIPSPFSLIGLGAVNSYIATTINGFLIYPDPLGIPIIITMLTLLIYGIVKIIMP